MILILIMIMIMILLNTGRKKPYMEMLARQTSDTAREVSWRCSRMSLLLLFVLFFKKGT